MNAGNKISHFTPFGCKLWLSTTPLTLSWPTPNVLAFYHKTTNMIFIIHTSTVKDIWLGREGHMTYSNDIKLHTLFKATFSVRCMTFLNFHTKSHHMKALVILSHPWSPFLPLTCLNGKKWTFVDLCAGFWSIFLRKTSPRITNATDMWAVLVMGLIL